MARCVLWVAACLQLNCLKRELMDAQELLSSRGFEVVQMQRRLEELAHRLTEKNASLDGHKEVLDSQLLAVFMLCWRRLGCLTHR